MKLEKALKNIEDCNHNEYISLDINRSHNQGDSLYETLKLVSSEIECLDVCHNWADEKTAQIISEKFKKLKVLDISGSHIGLKGFKLLAKNLPNLNTLCVGQSGVNEQILEVIVKGFPNLISLNLSCSDASDYWAKLIATYLPNLQELDISHYKVTIEGVDIICEGLKKLTKLNLGSISMAPIGATAIANNLHELTELCVNNCKIQTEGIIAISNKLSKLTKLYCSSNNVDDEGALAISKGLNNLTELISHDNNISDKGIIAIANCLPRLKKLLIANNQIGDKGAIAISQNLKRLVWLSISDNKLTNEGANIIKKELVLLKELDIQNHKPHSLLNSITEYPFDNTITEVKNFNFYSESLVWPFGSLYEKHKQKLSLSNKEYTQIPTATSKNIFISYSKNELQYCRELHSCFANLERQGLVSIFDDGMIEPGTQWDEVIRSKLAKSDLVLCLLSRSFMANNYIWEVEIKKAQERLQYGRIIPVFISKCDFYGTVFQKLSGLLNIKHLPESFQVKSHDNGTVWIALEPHQPTREFYYGIILEKIMRFIQV